MKKYIFVAMVVALLLAVGIPTACAKKPAEFTVSDLVLTPAEAQVWQEVTATAKVKNIGQVEGTCNVTLKINGQEVETKGISVAGGATETVTFTFKRDTGPSCDIDINGLTKTLVVKEGILPTLSIGDKWALKFSLEPLKTEYTMTLELTGEDVTDGKDCYVMQGSLEPPLTGGISKLSLKFDKAIMEVVRLETSVVIAVGELKGTSVDSVTTYSYEFPDALPYPFEVGKEYKMVKAETTTITMTGHTDTSTDKHTYVRKVEGIEEITVPAGTFRCFKIVEYDEQGNLRNTTWQSDKAKGYNVKTIDKAGKTTTELISYVIH